MNDYRINSEVQTAYSAYSTGIHKSFVTHATENDGTRYYLSTSFIPDDPLDKIHVEIFKITSEKCDLDILSQERGCESKYF